MKKILLVTLLTALLADASLAGPLIWLRRVSAVTSCGASYADFRTTQVALAQGRGVEGNPLARNPNLNLGIRAGFCAIAIGGQEADREGKHTKRDLIMNIFTTGLFGGMAWHNSRVGR